MRHESHVEETSIVFLAGIAKQQTIQVLLSFKFLFESSQITTLNGL